MDSRAPRGKVVYSTGVGRVCPTCGWPAGRCRCSSRFDQAVPERVTAKLRLESKGRGGKSVTVIDGLPRNTAFLDELLRTLKSSLGTGGTVREGAIELQGDRRDALRALLAGRGFTVKG
jgi:translation initiation factor 1